MATPNLQVVQKWLLEKLEYEAANQVPAPLTDAQRTALLDLEVNISMTEEPDLGDTNWIGTLLEHCNAKKTIATATYEDAAVPNTGIRGQPTRWRTSVRVSSVPGIVFPVYEGDSSAGSQQQQQPSFVKKKDAKQYAAKCALEWLRSQGHVGGGGKSSNNNTTGGGGGGGVYNSHQQQHHQQNPPASPAKHANKKRKEDLDSTSSSSPPHLSSSTASPLDPSQKSATLTVAALCAHLGIPQPSYRMAPTMAMLAAEQQGTYLSNSDGVQLAAEGPHELWSGRADFSPTQRGAGDGTFFPTGLGSVDNVYGGRKVTKERVAERLVPYLSAAWKKRQEERDTVLAEWDDMHNNSNNEKKKQQQQQPPG